MMINPMSPQRAAILKVLQEASGPMRVKDIAIAANMKYRNVAMRLLLMRDDEQAEQNPVNGLWQARVQGQSTVEQIDQRIYHSVSWATVTPQRTAILDVLQKADKPMRPTEIAATLNLTRGNVQNRLARMLDDEQVKHVGYGQWVVWML